VISRENDQILEKIPEGILILNDEDGDIEYINYELRDVLCLDNSPDTNDDQAIK
jgi:hypothetical protein